MQTYTTEIKKILEESPEELLEFAIVDIRQKIFSNAKEILVPIKLDIELDGVKFSVPKQGDKKKLLELSERNAKYFRLEKLKNATHLQLKDEIISLFNEKSLTLNITRVSPLCKR